MEYCGINMKANESRLLDGMRTFSCNLKSLRRKIKKLGRKRK